MKAFDANLRTVNTMTAATAVIIIPSADIVLNTFAVGVCVMSYTCMYIQEVSVCVSNSPFVNRNTCPMR